MELIILPCPAQIILIDCALLGFLGDGGVALGLGVANLHFVGQQELGKHPGSQHLLGVCLVEHANGGALGNHGDIFRIKLGNRHHHRFKIHNLLLGNIHQGRVASHPGGTGGGVNGEDALAPVKEIGGVAVNFEGGECAALHLRRNVHQQFFGGIVKQQHIAAGGGIARIQLPEHLNHHIVGGFVNTGNQGFLPVYPVIATLILCGGCLTDFPDKVPCQFFRQREPQFFHIGFVHIAAFCGAHERQGIAALANAALGKKLRHDLLLQNRIKPYLTSPQTVFFVRHQPVQRHHGISAGEVGGDMVRVGDAHIGSGIGGDVGNHILINPAVIGVQLQIHLDIGIQRLKVRNGLFIDIDLIDIGIILGPEGNFILPGFVKAIRHFKSIPLHRTVAAAQQPGQQSRQQNKCGEFFHPLLPPLATPSIIFRRNTRNSTISGREITTAAAIMAGIFSRPKPLSRMACRPLDTRK